jgi:EAL domain-containing protein (putative c-di-GMP-specific phosphodiesterase class I)
VLQEACRQLREWNDAGHSALRVAINVSPFQVWRAGFVESVALALQRFGIDGAQIDIEITEGLMVETNPQNIAILEKLVALGVRLLINDFGAGYSNLRYLQAFPIHGLKIGRGFVQSMSDRPGGLTITAAIIAMAEHLNLQVIAEGVETAEQAALLQQQGCQIAQGFFLGRPESAQDFIRRCQK